MAKAKECIVICNTRNGHCLQPYKCKSINEAIRYAKELDLAYRIFIDGKCVKSGW
jgi:hypothetical protein